MYLSRTTKWQKVCSSLKRCSMIPFQKKMIRKMPINEYFWLNTKISVPSDVMYCQWVHIYQIIRWKIFFILTLLKNNTTILCTWNTLDKGEWGEGGHIWLISYIVPFLTDLSATINCICLNFNTLWLGMPYWGDLFLDISDVNFLLSDDIACFYFHIRAGVPLVIIGSHIFCFFRWLDVAKK